MRLCLLASSIAVATAASAAIAYLLRTILEWYTASLRNHRHDDVSMTISFIKKIINYAYTRAHEREREKAYSHSRVYTLALNLMLFISCSDDVWPTPRQR